MRHKVENLFAKLKDWRPVATRYDRCAPTFLSTITLLTPRHLLVMGPEPSGGAQA